MDTPKLIGPAPLTVTRVPEPAPAMAVKHAAGLPPSEASLSLAHFVRIVRCHTWKLVAFVTIAVLGALLVTLKLEKLYESAAVVKVDRPATRGVVGYEALQVLPDNDLDQIITTQVEEIRSDPVLRPVAEKYHLLEMEKQLSELTAAQALRRLGAPITLRGLKVTRPPNTSLIKISYSAGNPQLAADVANAIAHSFISHATETRNRAHTQVKALISRELTELRSKMEASSQALAQVETQLNMVDPQQPTTILVSRLTQLNTELTAAQTERLRKEAVLDSVNQNPTIAAAQAAPQAETIERAIERLNGARQQFATIQTVYGENHPEYRKAKSQVAELEAQVEQLRANTGDRLRIEYEQALDRENRLRAALNATKAEVDAQSAPILQYLQLKRDAENDKKLYEDLDRKTQEADINNQFQDAVVQVAEAALPADRNISPNLPLNLAVVFVLSSIFGVAGVVVTDALNTRVWDPEELATRLNVDVLSLVPATKSLPRPSASGGRIEIIKRRGRLLNSALYYGEAIRSLRGTIEVTTLHSPLRSILLTSANPSEGKSTTAAHLAASFAEIGKKILLIDADLHRPTAHTRFNLDNSRGLSDVLAGRLPFRKAIVQIEGDLYLLPAGPVCSGMSDLVGTRIAGILEEACGEFEIVIIDAPSLLACPESQQIAAFADGTVVVVKARSTTSNELARTLAGLSRARANIMGIVLNHMKRSDGKAYGYYPSSYVEYARR